MNDCARARQTRSPRIAARSGALLAALGVLCAPAIGQGPRIGEDDRPIRLRVGRIETRSPARDLVSLTTDARRDGGRVIVQLDGPMTPARRKRLEAAGVRLGGYIPDNAFIADLSHADAAALGALDFVRWQGAYEPAWKRDPLLARRTHTDPARRALARAGLTPVIVTLFQGADAGALARELTLWPGNPRVHFSDELAGNPFLVVTIGTPLLDRLARRSEVQFIEEAPELTDRSNTNDRWIVQSNVTGVTPFYDAGLHGEDQIIGIIDGSVGGLDLNHCSFRDAVNNTPGPGHRKVLAYNAAPGAVAHATHVSATAAGDNGAEDDTRGVAWASKIVYAARPAFDQTSVAAAFGLHHAQGARVHSNSWGDDGAAWYTSLCRGLDSFIYDNEESLVCFAVTNTAALKTPENAKNVLAVGATQGAPAQDNFCSGGIGPTADGRRKPEVFAPGCSTISALSNSACGVTNLTGTSMACPVVAGAGALARQYFTTGFYPSGAANPVDAFIPSAALLKASIINSAVNMTGIGGFPSDLEGWGRVLLDNALFLAGDANRLILRDVRNAAGMETGDIIALGVSIASTGQPLKVTLVWTEPAATLGADLVQVNDLDLEVISPTGAIFRGNVFAFGQSAVGGTRDDRNNVEQVLLTTPDPGLWSVRVRAAGVNVGTQGYALVVTGDVAEAPGPLAVGVHPPPELIAPGAPLTVRVTINPGDDTLTPGAAQLFYRSAPADAFASMPLNLVAGDLYEATLPGFSCGQTPEFFASATGVATGAITDPPDQPTTLIATSVGAVSVMASDDFEADQGWSSGAPGDTATTGQWVRADPLGTAAQPEDDHSPDPGAAAWITGQHLAGQGNGFADVDGGATTLLSPIFDLSNTPSPSISYWRWFYTSSGGLEDSLRVDISSDGGATWFPVEAIGNSGARLQALGGWFAHAFDPEAFAPALTSTMRLRFVATDAAPGSIVEAGIDDFAITSLACVAPPFCQGDANGDLIVNFQDITAVLSNWGEAPGFGGPGDANNDGAVDFQDITAVLSNWGAVCQ